MKKFPLRLSDKEYEKIKEYAEANEMSMNEVIRDIIRRFEGSLSSPSCVPCKGTSREQG